jgi:translin
LVDYQRQLEQISQKAIALFDEKEKAREHSLSLHRQIIKLSGNAIKLMHRGEFEEADKLLAQAQAFIESLSSLLHTHPDVFYGGFVQNAQKEYTEARSFQAIILSKPIPSMEELKVDIAPYLNGLGEAIGELRRYVLDSLRNGNFETIENTLQIMDEIYYVLCAIDYPDALTLGLRRTADIARSLVEKTRGDLTTSLQQKRLEEALKNHKLHSS